MTREEREREGKHEDYDASNTKHGLPNRARQRARKGEPVVTFGVPEPVETGFAYAQFKCEYYCNNKSEGGSFFVHADSKVGSYCECYDELMDPETFINNNQTLVGAWNAICKA
ncbi:hypothetical protein F5Y01DRAFT_313759 [Xylaria sp. FL0043]|nr:hypothetical protein F5Y01DRAFT_313759 [Xylaria sp. FL0043]